VISSQWSAGARVADRKIRNHFAPQRNANLRADVQPEAHAFLD
jgi:hypothetical protein